MIQSIKVKSWNEMGNNGLICALQGVMYPECMIMSCCKSGYVRIIQNVFFSIIYPNLTLADLNKELFSNWCYGRYSQSGQFKCVYYTNK
ncbi:hypothetical protein RchiOBHm_Chr1g0324891 [Rosa chinensis]|uniref:Uncharacterized protein n=1 Tax=Rosa chinensis TaxID=74649 RepID=A0A2P6S9Y7_ROSCH|nr:hypothetical protein RchiOBHm_Chr1g0324891 [Rosa chinensis]